MIIIFLLEFTSIGRKIKSILARARKMIVQCKRDEFGVFLPSDWLVLSLSPMSVSGESVCTRSLEGWLMYETGYLFHATFALDGHQKDPIRVQITSICCWKRRMSAKRDSNVVSKSIGMSNCPD